jgi:ADP-ribosylglycohydrolase
MGRVHLALDGLSVGDAFGQQFFDPTNAKRLFGPRREPPPAPWFYTDDTEMALAVAEVLDDLGSIDQDYLARLFAIRYNNEPQRGYGATARQILAAIGRGESWRRAAPAAFDGQGSMGNGAAMRVAPVGAYFADDLARVVAEARASAEVTHAHSEGVAGAIAVAVAAAVAWRERARVGADDLRAEFFQTVLAHTPAGLTRRGIERAAVLSPGLSVATAASLLGTGLNITSQDTVPFALWCATRHLPNLVDALWTTVSGLGDRDTTCAIVGGVVALAAGRQAVPEDWLGVREPLRRRT